MTKRTIVGEDLFGSCPRCGRNNGYVTVVRTHWCVCDTHHTRWLVGSNVFTDFPDAEESRINAEKLEGYDIVEPLMEGETTEVDD